MKKFVVFLGLAAIVLLSYGLMTGLFSEPALVEATGPILGMTVAASLDEQGQPVDASFTYPTDQPEMVVLVRIGEVSPGPLTFSWYRVTDAGDEALFEQTVTVEARDAAFSTGLNPGILAAATYKVVATFAGGSETIVWDVAESQPDDLTAPLGTSQSAAGGTPTPVVAGFPGIDVVLEAGPRGTTPAAALQSVKGKLKSTTTGSADNSTSVTQVDADLSLDLKPDGTLSGTAKITYAFHGEGTLSDGCSWSASIDPMHFTLPITGKWTEDSIVFRYTTAAPIMAAETMITCGNRLTVQLPIESAVLVGADWRANWDEQKKAYTADDRVSSSGAGSTTEHHWTIHLEPPAPD